MLFGSSLQTIQIIRIHFSSLIISNQIITMSRYKKFSVRCLEIHSFQEINSYVLRQEFTIESIPECKITSIKNNSLLLKVEVCSKKLIHYLKSIKVDIVSHHFLQTTIDTCEFLYLKYGCFAISDNNLLIDSNNRPKIWIHEDITINKCQLPLPNSKSGLRAMIKSILSLFKFCLKSYEELLKIDNFKELKRQLRRLSMNKKTDCQIKIKPQVFKSTIFQNRQASNNLRSCKNLKDQFAGFRNQTTQNGFSCHKDKKHKYALNKQFSTTHRNQTVHSFSVNKPERITQKKQFNKSSQKAQQLNIKKSICTPKFKKQSLNIMQVAEQVSMEYSKKNSQICLPSQDQSTIETGEMNSHTNLFWHNSSNNILSNISKKSFASVFNEQVQNQLNELFCLKFQQQSQSGNTSIRLDLQKEFDSIF